jgi:hypothetical protein
MLCLHSTGMAPYYKILHDTTEILLKVALNTMTLKL